MLFEDGPAELYNEQAERDAVFCDICGHYHSPNCDELQQDSEDDEADEED